MISTQSAGNECSLIGRLNSYHTIWMTDKIKNRYAQYYLQASGINSRVRDLDADGLKYPEYPNPTVPEKMTPGLEAVFAITGLLVVTYLMRWKKS
jgi:hypothetical protein